MFNLLKQFQDTESVKGILGQCRPRAPMARDLHLSIIARHNGKTTGSQLTSELHAAKGAPVSRVTVYIRLHERGLFVRRPVVCDPLSSEYKRVHLK
ncbi:transposable element Tcb2 transposase [Trichonephila clavipes]|nr:transposable element Tcb2 transposase [Trichonephila clavipes]